MKTDYITYADLSKYQFTLSEFEEALDNATLRYSLRNLTIIENVSEETKMEALQKSLQVCHLTGIDSKHHFKLIYISDIAIGTLYTDWLMSKNGVNLMIMQIPSLNAKTARWLWELADV